MALQVVFLYVVAEGVSQTGGDDGMLSAAACSLEFELISHGPLDLVYNHNAWMQIRLQKRPFCIHAQSERLSISKVGLQPAEALQSPPCSRPTMSGWLLFFFLLLSTISTDTLSDTISNVSAILLHSK